MKGNAMPDNTDLMKLYSQRILALAADLPHTVRLTDPAATAKKRAPLCGSTVTVDVEITDGKITGFGQDVKACALGQAAASVLGAAVIDQPVEVIRQGQAELAAMLKSNGPVPAAPFDALEVLRPAIEYQNRHASILLAFDATVAAIDDAQVTS